MIALVDEWGNPQPGSRGTEWFGFAAVMIPDSDSSSLFESLLGLRKFHNPAAPHSVHVRNIRGDSKYHLLNHFANLQAKAALVCVNINRVRSPHLRQRGWAYRYYGREIVRIITHYAREINEVAHIVFDRHVYLNEFEEYISNILPYLNSYTDMLEQYRILFDRIGSIHFYSNDEFPELCLADGLAHAAGLAFNPTTKWRAINPSYLDLYSNSIWKGPVTQLDPWRFGLSLEPNSIANELKTYVPTTLRNVLESS